MVAVLKCIFFSIFFITGSVNYLQAQLNLSQYEIGLSGGIFVYQGDLTPQTLGSYKTIKPQIALHVFRIISPAISARININRGSLYGNEGLYETPEYRKQRNFKFTTNVTEISVQALYSFLHQKNFRLSPYVFGGGGFSILNVSRDYSGLDTEVFGAESEVQQGLAIDIATTPTRLTPVIPVGVGARYNISNRFSAIVETSYRLGFTDYLDGFSKSVNPNKNDHYFSHSAGLVYSFKSKKEKMLGCPVW